jgi:hypothetical protein
MFYKIIYKPDDIENKEKILLTPKAKNIFKIKIKQCYKYNLYSIF